MNYEIAFNLLKTNRRRFKTLDYLKKMKLVNCNFYNETDSHEVLKYSFKLRIGKKRELHLKNEKRKNQTIEGHSYVSVRFWILNDIKI